MPQPFFLTCVYIKAEQILIRLKKRPDRIDQALITDLNVAYYLL
jgi:hypothetical protein